jgi:hypothetical protein
MNKTLHIYGRNFDEINKYIKGISFSNVVTYDKQDNTPDIYLKNSVLGWDLISSVVEKWFIIVMLHQKYLFDIPLIN